MSNLTARIDEALDTHCAGLIGGDRLRPGEVIGWIELLTMAAESKTPVKTARFYGFEFINRRADIDAAIHHLTYN